MNYWLKILLLIITWGSHSILSSQSQNTEFSQIKDTSELYKTKDLVFSKVKETKTIDKDEILFLLKSSLELRDTSTFFTICSKISRSYYDFELSDDGIIFLKESQQILNKPNNRYGELNNNLGNLYMSIESPVQALDHFYLSKTWHEKYDEANTTIPLGNIASIYFDNKNYEKALSYNELALSYSLKLTDPDSKLYNIIFDYYRIGAINHELLNNVKAEQYFQKSLSAAREYGDMNLKLLSLKNAIKFYSDIEDYSTCEKLIVEANQHLQSLKEEKSKSKNLFLIEINKYYLKSGQLEKALSPEKIQDLDDFLQQELFLYSAKYYKEKNDIEKTVESYIKLIEGKEKIEIESKKYIFADLENKYINKELKEKNLELTNDAKKRKKTITTILIALFVIISFLVLQLLNNRRNKKLNKLLQSKTNELKKTNNELRTSNEELERFAYITSHDLRTPLRNIVSFTGLLERKLETNLDEKVTEYLSIIKKGGLKLNNIITNTLEFSKLSSHKIDHQEKLDLNIIINEIKHSLSTYIQQSNTEIIIAHTLPNIKANYYSILLLFQNLIENAIKYNSSKKPEIKLYSEMNSDFLSIYVEDNGIGISEDYHDMVFVMFSRLHNDEKYQGTGIGLSMCKKIVEQMEGEIHIKSKVGEGSIFEIKLPHKLIVR